VVAVGVEHDGVVVVLAGAVGRLHHGVAGGGEVGAEVVDGVGRAERAGDLSPAGPVPVGRRLGVRGRLDQLEPDAAEVEEHGPPPAGRVLVWRRGQRAELLL
jgi:hypothetical protein